jgi:hypothetical protein
MTPSPPRRDDEPRRLWSPPSLKRLPTEATRAGGGVGFDNIETPSAP